MRKIIFLSLAIIMLTKVAFGVEPVSTESYISPESVTINRLENNREVLTDAINNFNGGWILKNTISPDSMKDNGNVVIFRDEAFNDWVFAGLLPQTASGLTSNITGGTGYINGERVVKDTLPKTYNTSKWTFVDISDKGTYTLTEVAIDAAEPSTTANSIRLARVTTDGSDITAVRDDRVTAISLATGEDFYIKGFEMTMDSAFNIVTVDSGFLRHGTTAVNKTSVTGILLDTAADWHDGNQDTLNNQWCYVGIDNLGAVKYLGANAPDKSDTSGNTSGTFRYWYNTVASKYWRIVNQVRVNAANDISDDLIQSGKRFMWNKPVNITTTVSSGAWSAATSCAAGIPEASEFGIFGLSSKETQANLTAAIFIRPNGSAWATNAANGIYDGDGSASSNEIGGQRSCMTDSSQQIQYQNSVDDDSTRVEVEGFVVSYRD